jgi:hypothetical protein
MQRRNALQSTKIKYNTSSTALGRVIERKKQVKRIKSEGKRSLSRGKKSKGDLGFKKNNL